MMQDTAVTVETVARLLRNYRKGDADAIIHLLQDIQEAFNYLPREVIVSAADYLEVPHTRAFSIATFYKVFSLEPRGETVVKVCMGTSCHIRGADIVVDDLREGIGAGPGETTKDMKFTVEVVNCVGACALAPVVIANGKYLADVKPGTVVSRLGEV